MPFFHRCLLWVEDRSLRVSSPTLFLVALLLLILSGGSAAQAQTPSLKISEFRLSGPGGSSDEFIEVYNFSPVPFDAAGWSVGSSATRITVPAGNRIPGYGCLLLTGSGYSLSDYGGPGAAAGDVFYFADIPDGSPLQLRDGAGTLVDQVDPGALPLPLSLSDNYSYLRRLDSGSPQDTDNDLNDFNLVDVQSTDGANTTNGISSGIRRLGAPGPQNRHSLTPNTSLISVALASPATVRTGSGNSGTLALRRIVTNRAGSGRTITALRFRIVALSAGVNSAASASAVADIRLTSSNISDGTILPLALQQPPTQPNGGGLNASVIANLSSLPGGGLSPGQSVSVEFLFNIVKAGNYGFSLNAEPDPSPAQPDLAVRLIEEGEEATLVVPETAWTGVDVFSGNGSNQTIASATMLGLTRRFALRLTNAGDKGMAFRLNLPDAPAGWTQHLFDAPFAGNEIILTEQNWNTPSLAPGASLQLRLEATPSATATADYAPVVTALSSVVVDAIKASCPLQTVSKLQWSRDGQNWNDFDPTYPPEIEHNSTLGVRAVKSASSVEWPEPQQLGPKWKWQGNEVTGETVWIQGENITGEQGELVTAELGGSLSQTVRVLPKYDTTLGVSRSVVLSGPGPSVLKTVTLSALVTDDDDDTPKAGVKVRFRGLTSSGVPAGEVGTPLPSDDYVLTNAQGIATAVWTDGSEVGEVRLEAMPLDEKGRSRGAGDTNTIRSNACYIRFKLGEWIEANGAWSRSISASVWFMGEKVPGRALSLTSQIKDFDTDQALGGWQNAAPLDAATGTTNANGDFTTVQRWNPVEAGAWPQDYKVAVGATTN